MEFTLLFAAGTGVVFAWVGLKIWPENLPERPLDRLIGAAVTGLVAGRLTAMLSHGVNPITNPGDFIIVRGGVSTVGATVGFMVFLLWTSRSELRSLDALAPAVVLGMAGWHAGCLWRNTCLGTASDLPWAWAQDASAITRHPVEIYAVLLLISAAFVVGRLGWRPWLRFGAALFSTALVRLATEPLRPNLDGGPVVWYAAGVVLGIGLMSIGPSLLTRHPIPT